MQIGEEDLSARPRLLAGSRMMKNINCWQGDDLIFIVLGDLFCFRGAPFEKSISFTCY